MQNIKRKILDWLDLYSADEVEKIVEFWTLQHKQASVEIDRLRKEYLSSIAYDPKKVIKVGGGKLKLGEYELTDQEAKHLQEEAGFLKQSELWKIFTNTLTELARQNMFEVGGVKTKDLCDFHVGKATIFDIKAMREILENIINYQPKK